MARKKQTIVTETLPDFNLNDPIPGEESILWDTSEDDPLAKVKAQYGGSPIKIKVYKIVTGKAQPVFCFSSEETVDEEQLQEMYGGGKYALRFFVDNALKHTTYVEVSDKPQKTNGAGADPASIQIQMLREQSQFSRDLLLGILGRNAPVVSPTPMSDIAAMWGLIHGANPQQSSGLDKMIDLFTKGLEIGASRSDGGNMDWKTALIQTIKEIAPTVTQVVASAKGINLPSLPNNGGGVPADLQTPTELLKTGIQFLKAKILAGLPVGLALDWIINNAADYQQFLSVALSKPFEDFVAIDNELANEPFNSWMRQLLEGLKENYKETSAPDSETEE